MIRFIQYILSRNSTCKRPYWWVWITVTWILTQVACFHARRVCSRRPGCTNAIRRVKLTTGRLGACICTRSWNETLYNQQLSIESSVSQWSQWSYKTCCKLKMRRRTTPFLVVFIFSCRCSHLFLLLVCSSIFCRDRLSPNKNKRLKGSNVHLNIMFFVHVSRNHCKCRSYGLTSQRSEHSQVIILTNTPR